MIWLGVDTATRSLSVAVVREGAAAVESTLETVPTHAACLMPAIGEVMARAGVGFADLDAFAVTSGPGSFTGLRIGISTVKGLALATDRPVWGVSTLEVLARQAGSWEHDIQPMVDARRGEVYTVRYRREGPSGRLAPLGFPAALPPEAALAEARPQTLFIGDGALRYIETIRARLASEASIADAALAIPRAATVVAVAVERFRRGERGEAQALSPLYLRRSDARDPKAPLCRISGAVIDKQD